MIERYTDEQCRYLGGDLRLQKTGPAEIELQEDCVRIQLLESDEQGAVLIPRAAIQGVRTTTERLGMEQAEYEAGVFIGPDQWLTRYTAILDVKDLEGIKPGGLEIRIAFRDEYFSKVFEKRCREGFNLPPF